MHASNLSHVLHIGMKSTRYFLLLLPLFFAPLSAAELPLSAMEINHLAGRHELAKGVARNYHKAFQLYCIAAALGNAEARYNLGRMYFNGRGLKRSKPLAVGWFQKAAALGDDFAENRLKQLLAVSGKKDSSCPLPHSKKPDKEEIEAWVRIIAPVQTIDPKLVLAVIQAESAFNSKALSNKNAQGLMQLIPKTARRFGVNDSWNPIENILGGTRYIRWLMRHFKGDVKTVLAAYNAGEKAVKRHNGIPPYRETRQYVSKIMARYKKEKHPVPPI